MPARCFLGKRLAPEGEFILLFAGNLVHLDQILGGQAISVSGIYLRLHFRG
jgi:hypothetical protein